MLQPPELRGKLRKRLTMCLHENKLVPTSEAALIQSPSPPPTFVATGLAIEERPPQPQP